MSKVASKLNKKMNASKKSSKLKIKMKTKATSSTGIKSSKTSAKSKVQTRGKAQVLKASKKVQEKELIVVDESQGLIFENDKTLFGFFSEQIKFVEGKYAQYFRAQHDFSEDELYSKEHWLEATLDDPDEIWVDQKSFKDVTLYTLIKNVEQEEEPFAYLAVVYLNTEEKYPSFVFIHFATKDIELAELFRFEEIIYHRKLESIQFASLEGDSLLEGDYLAIGLLESMMKLRHEKDIQPENFKAYADQRDETINNPDEIWRKVDSEGHTLVTFIKDVSEVKNKDDFYVVVTEEDPNTEVHSLLFSFPTNDSSLVDRYRQGENLEAEEVSTESSH